MTSETIPPPIDFARHVVTAYPDVGAQWLAALPASQSLLAERWKLTLLAWVSGGRTACVLDVRTDTRVRAVLKIPVKPSDAKSEHLALAHWNGDGAASVLRFDDETGALLLEWVNGRPLSDEPDCEITLQGAVTLLRRLHRRDNRALPSLPTLEEKIGPLRRLREREEERRGGSSLAAATGCRETGIRQWLAETEDRASSGVIHGDLQPRNILVGSDGGFTAIDPYGVIGEPARDVAYLGLMFREDGRAWQRLEALTALLRLDGKRVMGHAYVIAVGAYRFRRVYGMAVGLSFLRDYIARYEQCDLAFSRIPYRGRGE